MPFFIKQVSSHGTSDPIFARLSVQTHELIQFCAISQEKKDAIFRILHDDVQPRLLTCDDIAKAIVTEIEAVMSQIAAEGLKTQAQGRVFLKCCSNGAMEPCKPHKVRLPQNQASARAWRRASV